MEALISRLIDNKWLQVSMCDAPSPAVNFGLSVQHQHQLHCALEQCLFYDGIAALL
jgi:hypothetical protein